MTQSQIVGLALVASVLPIESRGQEAQPDEVETKSGYQTVPGFGGPSSTQDWNGKYRDGKLVFAAGIGVRRGEFNLLGLGLNWGQPSGDLSDQYAAEFFYRFQLFPNFTLTPDLQFIIDPALDPDQERLFVFGLRVRATF